MTNTVATAAQIKSALGAVRVRKFPASFRVCTLDESPVAPFVAGAEALGFRACINSSHEMFLYRVR